jgi:hypothetical protein
VPGLGSIDHIIEQGRQQKKDRIKLQPEMPIERSQFIVIVKLQPAISPVS